MPFLSAFAQTFTNYLTQARIARDESRHHDYRRQLFLSFLDSAFHIRSDEVDVERFIKIDVRRRGWIDALFHDLVFEFKRDLERERSDGLRELTDYLTTLPNGNEGIGLLTDGLAFEIYSLSAGRLNLDDRFNLDTAEAEPAFLWLDSYLFSQRNLPPTSADIVRRFGLYSPTFRAAAKTLHDLLARLEQSPTLQVKRQQWRAVLAKVYGSDIGSDALFVRHTFLNQFAKILAYSALTDSVPQQNDLLLDIITGQAFHRFGVSNLGEIDFFAWILDEAVKPEVIAMLRRLADTLRVYDLTQINEDLLKQLYQNLVDPEMRHELGEYYTPDWLAELTLAEAGYSPGLSLLDPSSGSGTFLFTAIRMLAAQGLTGWALVDFALENIAGMDVHPLAVTIARTNYLLAISPHMQQARPDGQIKLSPLPVYMADALLTPAEGGPHHDTLVIPVDHERNEVFHIPVDAAQEPGVFTSVVEQMVSASYWSQNLRLLNRLIQEGRNSIWAYMLKNTARPLLLAARKFDRVVGNPPWLAYRYIRDKTYQQEVKALTFAYGLLARDEVKLFTTMDLATLFMVHCERQYLCPGGLIALVMPRSVITGSRQHRAFRERGLSRVLDLKGVTPLFNTESCVLIRQENEIYIDNVPTTRYMAALPNHEMILTTIQSYLNQVKATTRLIGQVTIASPHYYEKFHQGASLTPRNLCFVRPKQVGGFSPVMTTDPDADREAKAPWKGIAVEGRIYPRNLYATLLSKYMLPFGWQRLHLTALPVRVEDNQLKVMDEEDFLALGLVNSWRTWFKPAEQKWDELKKATSQIEDLIDQFNYQQKLTIQRLAEVYKVLYNTSGTHLSSCVLDTYGSPPNVYNYLTQGFVADTKTYYCETQIIEEAHYLCALLNAPCVDTAIKAYQTRGIYKGERDIHRAPFEACAIPPFDPGQPDYLELARLSQKAHALIAAARPQGEVVKARRLAREVVTQQLEAIDTIAAVGPGLT